MATKLFLQFFSRKMSTQILTKKINLENKLHEHISINDKISRIFPDTKVHAISVDYDGTPSNKKFLLKGTMTSHRLAATILHAYNNHQHLCLSPNDVWLTIAQGVSHHINFNAERFRHYFVNHKGKKKILVYAGDILDVKNSRLEGD